MEDSLFIIIMNILDTDNYNYKFVEYCQPVGLKINVITDLFLKETEPPGYHRVDHIHHHKFKLGKVLLVAETERPCKYDF